MAFKVGVGTAIRAAYTDNGVPYMWESGDVTTTPNEVGIITASNGSANDNFGISVAAGNGRIVVSSPNSISNAGSAYIYDLNRNQLGIITAFDGVAGDYFGESVAVGSGRIVVGAPFDDVGSNANQGSAYIFDLNGNQLGIISASDGAAGYFFGNSVAVGSGKIVAGAPYTNVGSNNAQGAAYIFDLDGNQLGIITASDGAANDNFGFSVAVGSGKIVIGAYLNDGNTNSSGSAYIYNLDGTNEVKITASDGALNDYFGYSVAVGSGRIVVGARFDDDNGNQSGSAYIYNLDGTNEVKITASDGASGDDFGRSVAVGSGRIVVGAYGDNVGSNDDQGSAYIFDLDGNQLSKITAFDGAFAQASDYFGYSVAVGSGRIVAGAYGDNVGSNNNQGSAYIFDTPQVYTLYDAIDLQYG